MTLISKVKTITPSMATAILANMADNRRPTPGRVEAYARDMSTGGWKLTHQGIAISEDGQLLDGQHRLLAVIKAGIPVDMLVTSGVDGVEGAIDTGRARSAGDVLAMRGVKYSTQVAAIARFILMYRDMPSLTWHGGTTRKTHGEILRVVEDSPHLEEVAQLAYQIKKGSGVPTSPMGVLLFNAWKHPNLSGFCDGLTTGANLSQGDARLPLRIIAVNATVGRRMDVQHWLALCIKAWNGVLKGRKIKHLKWARGIEAMPDIQLDAA